MYAAEVVTAPGTRNRNYCEIRIDADEKYFTGFYTSEINAYELNQDTDEGDHASRNLASRDAGRIELGDDLIVMCDKDMNVLMAVNVSRSGKDGERDGSIQKLNDLHAYIEVDQDAQKVWDITEVSFVNGNDDAITDKDIDLKVKSIAKDADSFVPALTGEDAGEYQITNITVTDGTAEVLYQADGTPILKGVESDLTLKVTLTSAEYTVNIDSDDLDASDTVEVSYTSGSKVVVDDGDTVPYNTELSIVITKTSGATIVYEVTANGGDPISANPANTYAYTVVSNTSITIAKTEKSNDGALTSLGVSAGTAPAETDLDDGDTPSVSDIPYGTDKVVVTPTVSEGATVKVWAGDKALGKEVAATGNGTYELEMGTYEIEVISEAGNVKTTVTLTLANETASTSVDLKKSAAGNGKVKVENASTYTVTILAAGQGVVTAADLLTYIESDDGTAEVTVIAKASDTTPLTDMNEKVTTTMKVLVTPQDESTAAQEFAIAFGAIA